MADDGERRSPAGAFIEWRGDGGWRCVGVRLHDYGVYKVDELMMHGI
jgi:hypothetical protein